MNPIVSAGRHHNERPFTGRHQMSSRVLSRCFVRDTFNSPLALCFPAAETPAISFSRLSFFAFSSLCPSRVPAWYNFGSSWKRRKRAAQKSAPVFIVRVARRKK